MRLEKTFGYESHPKTAMSDSEFIIKQLENYRGDRYGKTSLRKKIKKDKGINSLKKKIIFLKATAGYDIEDIVDLF